MNASREWVDYFFSLKPSYKYEEVQVDYYFQWLYKDLLLSFNVPLPKIYLFPRPGHYSDKVYNFSVILLTADSKPFILIDCSLHIRGEDYSLFVNYGEQSYVGLNYFARRTIQDSIERIRRNPFYKNLLFEHKIDDHYSIL